MIKRALNLTKTSVFGDWRIIKTPTPMNVPDLIETNSHCRAKRI
jgi:hypothetical protein